MGERVIGRSNRIVGLPAIGLSIGLFVIGISAQSSDGKQAPVVDSSTFGDLRPRAIGPGTTSGRISSLDVVNDNPRIVYAGTAGGGVWKSTNGGASFQPVFDEHIMSIGAVAVDQSKPDIVWVGTGEGWPRNSVSVGRGVFKSTDAGRTWTAVGADALDKTERIARLAIHPKQSDIVYVCALGHLWNANEERGVYRTSDGGKTWRKAHYVNPDTGCGDLAIDPQEPDVVYAAMYEVRRRPYFFTSGGPGSGLYRSKDGGKTWQELTAGLPSGDLGRIGLAIAPSRPSTVYAIVEAKETALYRSDDGGENWRKTSEGEAFFGVRARPFYFSNIRVDPVDHTRLYNFSLFFTQSTNGGRSFEPTNLLNPFGGVHGDHHGLWINPRDPTHMVLGTDGGVYVTRDRGSTWSFSASLPVAQFYHVTVDMQRPYRVYGGLQDNGSWSAPSRGQAGIRNRDWVNVGIGDGFNVFADPRDSSIVFSEYQGAQIRRLSLVTREMKDIRPHPKAGEPPYRFNWNAAFLPSPGDPTAIYLGGQCLFRSRDRGETWERLSPDLTTNDPEKQRQRESGGLTPDNTTAENHCTIITVAESALEASVLWVGTDDGNVQVTRDGGRSWMNVVKNVQGLPANTWVSMIEAGRHRRGVAFAAFDGHRTGDMKSYLYATEDYGKTWRPIVEGLDGYVHSVRQDLVRPDLLFAGTEFGLFVSIDAGARWSRLTSLPRVAVHDMQIHPREHDLVLATHGRGVQIFDDLTPLRHLTREVLPREVAVLPTRPASQRISAMLQEFPGDDEFTGPNPPDGAVITYYLKARHIFGKLVVEVLDASGRVVQTLPPGPRQGINRVFWNMRLPAPKSAAAPGLGARALAGPPMPEGRYTIRITKGDVVATGPLDIVADPMTPHPPAARQRRHALLMRLYEMQATLAYVADAAKDLRDQAKARAESIGTEDKAAGLATALDALATEVDTLHAGLVDRSGTFAAANPQLREKVIDVYGVVLSYGGAPTASQTEYAGVLEAELNKASAAFERLSSSANGLNGQLTAAGQKPLRVMTREEFEKN
jgi:photosystem II stability/assembly factor-like uncharacterized protein